MFELFNRVVGGTRGESHVSQRRILTSRRGHAGAVGDVNILTRMHLIPPIEHRSLRITSHTGAAHFMNAEPQPDGVIVTSHVTVASGGKHLGGVTSHVLTHPELILLQTSIEGEHRQPVLILVTVVKGHAILMIGQSLPEAPERDVPGTWLSGFFLQLRPERLIVQESAPVGATRAALVTEPAEILAFVLTDIAIARHVEPVRPPSAEVTILKPRDQRTRTHIEMMIHDITTELATVIPEAVREPIGHGVHQNKRGPESGGAQKNHAREVFGVDAGFRIENANAARPALLRIVNELIHNGVRAQRHVARFLGGGQRTGDTAEVGPEGAPANTHVAKLTGATLRAMSQRGGQVGSTPDDDRAIKLLRNVLLELLLDAGELHRREEPAVGELRKIFGAAADPDEALDMVVPRREIVVTDRPVDRDSIPRIGPEIQIAPAVTLTTPCNGASADLVPANPIESLLLNVGIIDLINKPVFGSLGVDVAGPGGNRLAMKIFARGPVAVRQLPGIQQGGGIFTVPDHAPAIENEGLQALLRELLRGPTSGDTGADNDGVEYVTAH